MPELAPPSLLERLTAKLGPRALHDALTPGQREALRFLWAAHARPMVQRGEREWAGQYLRGIDDLPWTTAFVCAGRGSGKSRLACEYARGYAEEHPGAVILLMGSSAATTRKTLGFGRGGLQNICPPWNLPKWSVLDQSFRWANGSCVYLFSSDAPESPRGFEFDLAILDELAFFRQLKVIVANVRFALRAGLHPRLLVTSTPRSSGALREVRDAPGTIIVRGSLYDNAKFLPSSYIADIEAQFKGTSFERAELWGDPAACDELEGALWRRGWLDKFRVRTPPKLRRVVVGVDPSASESREHDEAGIVVVGQGEDGHAYVLEDASGENAVLSPREWAMKAVAAVHRHGASHVIEESNRGGALASTLIKMVDPKVLVRSVGAGLNKSLRAAPIAAQTEAGRLHMVGVHAQLEDQLCSWDPAVPGAKSPGRLDALVWACTDILLKPEMPSQRGLNDREMVTKRRM